MKPLTSVQLTFKCPKAFDELQPCNGGWYCDGCHKIVHDFRGKEEEEIRRVFDTHGGGVCGMYEADRIWLTQPLAKWRKWLSAALIAMGFTGLYHTTYGQQPDSIRIPEPKTAVTENQNEIFGGGETSAEFPGGIEKFYTYLATHVVPDATCKPGEKAFLTFIVEKDGRLADVKILRSPYGKKMNDSLIRMFEDSPRWRPGQQNGRTLRQRYTVPITAVAAIK